MVVYIVIAVILLIYLVLVALLGSMFPEDLHKWIFRVIFWIFGLVGAGVFVWIHAKRQKRAKSQDGELGVADIDLLAREAESRLASGRLVRDPKLANLPLLLVIGEQGTTKTSTILHSGAEPQLLAGQVYQDTAVLPTRLANFWYAAETVIVEAGSKLLHDSDAWERLIRSLKPSWFRSTFGGGQQAPRAVLVCLDCETLAQPQGQEKLTSIARVARERLSQASRLLGIDLPVYVLFTKLDRLPAFSDYVRNLGNEEAAAPVGETLSLRRAKQSGVYAEQETARLTEAFNAVYFELCDKRLMLLAREQQEAKLPGTYEFPREFGKLRNTIVRFLVELCRPSQLDFGPFLRGFYFSGVRPVIVTEGTGRTAPSIEQASAEYGEATRLFGQAGAGAPQPQAFGGSGQTRKVPQWTFLTRLFNEVLLRDPSAAKASSYSRSSHLPKRLMFGALTSILLICIIGFTVSYANNSDFEERNLAAARALSTATPKPGELPSVQALTQLDTLRQSLVTIHQHRIEGRPWSSRWGLYTGEKIYDSLYREYFDRFRALLLNDAQNGVMTDLQQLAGEPPAGGDDASDQRRVYEKLAAYLITTDLHQCSSREAVSRPLFVRWPSGKVPTEQQSNLAAAQFDFYADMLAERNPYKSPSDAVAVEKGRRYLSKMQGIEREYLGMIAAASAQVKSVNFNRDFPGTEAVVINRKDVPGAFTREGWAIIQQRIANRGASSESGCDALIMGPYASSGADVADAAQQLQARYVQDFFSQWLDYLKSTRVAAYGSPADAAAKLERLGTAQSPLLANLWLASRHSAGGPPELAQMFQPPQFVVPPADQGYVADSNKGYLSDLFNMQNGWSQLAQSPLGVKDTAIVDSLVAITTTAKGNANQVALGFRGDQQGQASAATREILLAPIENSERLLQRLGPLDLNKQGQGLCTQISLLKRKYPFEPNATQDATLQEVAAVFHPQQGSLWALYQGNLQELLAEQGGRYAAKPGGRIQLSPQFVAFFNQAAAISRAFYPEGATEPQFVYAVAPEAIDTFNRLQLRIDGQILTSDQSGGKAQQFVWPGDSSGVGLYGTVGGGTVVTVLNYPAGPWAVFRYFSQATRVPDSGSGDYEWRPETSGQPLIVNGKVVTVRYNLNHGANPPILKKGYLSTLSCPSSVTR